MVQKGLTGVFHLKQKAVIFVGNKPLKVGENSYVFMVSLWFHHQGGEFPTRIKNILNDDQNLTSLLLCVVTLVLPYPLPWEIWSHFCKVLGVFRVITVHVKFHIKFVTGFPYHKTKW